MVLCSMTLGDPQLPQTTPRSTFSITRSPSYVSGLVTATVNISSQKWLRSADTNHYELLIIRLKFDERCFSHAGPEAWNELSTELQDLTDHTACSDASWRHFCLNVRLLHIDSLAAGHLDVSDGQSESEFESFISV